MAKTTYTSSRPVRQLPPLPRSRTPLAIISAVGLCLAVHSCAGLKSADAEGATNASLVRDQGPLTPTPGTMLARADATGKAKNDGVPRVKPKVRPEPLKTADEPLEHAAASLQSLYSQLDQAQEATIKTGKSGTPGAASVAMSQRAGVDATDDAGSGVDDAPASQPPTKILSNPTTKSKRPAAHVITSKANRPPLPMELGAQADEVATTSSVQAVAQSMETVAKVVPAPSSSDMPQATQTPPATLLSLAQTTTPKLTLGASPKAAAASPMPALAQALAPSPAIAFIVVSVSLPSSTVVLQQRRRQ